MLVPHDGDQVRAVEISNAGVRVILSLVLLAAFVVGSFSIGFFVKQSHHVRAQRLERENLLLAAEVDDMREQMQSLSSSLATLSSKDRQFRTIAGLPGIDDDVRQVGIGGPGTETLEAAAVYRLNPETGEKLFAASHDLDALVRQANLLHASMDEALRTLQESTARLEATPSISPSAGHLSSLFSRNRRHPVLKITRPHKGIDIAAPVGEAIHAPARGKVVFAGKRPGGYGLTVEIDHGYGFVTRFAHCSRLTVRTGDVVKRGDKIAEVGATGLVSGPHLHYEVEVDEKPVDPLDFIIADAVPD